MNRLPAQALAIALSFLSMLGSLEAQTDARDPAHLDLPIVPMTLRFRFVPQYFVQPIANDIRYSRIEALIGNDSRLSSNEIILTDKTTGTRVFYSNSPKTVTALKQTGANAYNSEIDLNHIEAADSSPAYQIKLHDRYGQNIDWRFIVSPRRTQSEAELLPRPRRLGLVLMNAFHRTPAEPGTTVTIGKETNVVDAASPSGFPQPFYSSGLTIAEIAPVTEFWTVLSSPPRVEKEGKWVLESRSGQRMLLVIDRVSDDQVLINQVDEDEPDLTSTILDVRRFNNNLALHSVSLTNQSQILRISFEPSLPFPACGSTDQTNVRFSVETGNQAVLASGTVLAERSLGAEHVVWRFNAPEWAQSKSFETGVNLVPNLRIGRAGDLWGRCGIGPQVSR